VPIFVTPFFPTIKDMCRVTEAVAQRLLVRRFVMQQLAQRAEQQYAVVVDLTNIALSFVYFGTSIERAARYAADAAERAAYNISVRIVLVAGVCFVIVYFVHDDQAQTPNNTADQGALPHAPAIVLDASGFAPEANGGLRDLPPLRGDETTESNPAANVAVRRDC
jgi:hypothetical protein